MRAVFGRPTAWAAELFALAPTGAGASGISPSALRVLGGQVLFEEVDSSCDLGLWTTELLDVVLFEGTNQAISLVCGRGMERRAGLLNWLQSLECMPGPRSIGVTPANLTDFNGQTLFHH
jgi:hypothetical protein